MGLFFYYLYRKLVPGDFFSYLKESENQLISDETDKETVKNSIK